MRFRHKYFVRMVEEGRVEGLREEPPLVEPSLLARPVNLPKDLPIFGDEH